MKREFRTISLIAFTVLIIIISSCSAGMESPADNPTATAPPGIEETPVPATGTLAPSPPATSRPTDTEGPILETPTPPEEQRIIEVEWPPEMRLGDSDIVRLSFLPSEGGYIPEIEFDEHEVEIEAAEISYREGFELLAIARMNAVGLRFEPQGDQDQLVVRGHTLNWRWTISPENAGTHRFTLELRIRWVPLGEGRIEEANLWDGGLEVGVIAPFGFSAPQVRMVGALGLFIGSVMAIPLAEFAVRRRLEKSRASRVRKLKPNMNVELDMAPSATVSSEEGMLLRALYHRHSRVTVETRYSSGYSGARTLLVQPTRADGRTDAFAIVKIGSASEIQAEFSNYETFVRHTLPPVTSRVQGPPVRIHREADAALEYTFVGMPGVPPRSLREFVLEGEVERSKEIIQSGLFSTFGAGWWMQRVPYTFRMGKEYDRLLPVHLVLETTDGRASSSSLSGKSSELDNLEKGMIVSLRNAVVTEVRPFRNTLTLSWLNSDGISPIRVRFQGINTDQIKVGSKIRTAVGRVVATRLSLLKLEAARCFPDVNFDPMQLVIRGRQIENPLPHLDEVLENHQAGTRSIIHGDLNLENILVGPGDLVWLIDFASTREGHTLFDFARLEAEVTTQVISELFVRHGLEVEQVFTLLYALDIGRQPEGEALGSAYVLLEAIRTVAKRLLFDPGREDELLLAQYLAYMGTLKFSNLDELPHAPIPKALAFATAGYLINKYVKSN